MGCFCRNLPPLQVDLEAKATVALGPIDPILPALHAWLSARWLPATPWTPDPAWLDIELPELPIPTLSLSVVLNLLLAEERCRLMLGIDLLSPNGPTQLARIVATLNARVSLLAEFVVDPTPWFELLQLEAQVRLVETAVAQNLFAVDVRLGVPPIGPWRLLLLRIKAIAPLIAIGKMLKIDWGNPNATALISARLRLLARIALPPLVDVNLVLQLVAQFDAIVRLRAVFGPHGYLRIRAMLELRMQRLLAVLPASIRLQADVLIGLPALPPNPSLLINLPTIRAAQAFTPQLVARLNWKVPEFEAIAMLTVGQPVTALVHSMTSLGINPIRLTPCNTLCDATRLAAASLRA